MEENRIYGSFGRRFLAWLFDELVLWLIPLIVLFVIIATISTTRALWLGLLWFGWELVFMQWILALGYRTLTMYYWHGTPGKILGGLTIEKEDGGKMTFVDTILRFPIGYSVSGIFWSLGFFWILKDPKRQGFHDHIAQTVVTQRGKGTPLVLSLSLLLVVIGFLIFATIQIGTDRSLWSLAGNDLTTFFESMKPFLESN